MRTRWQGWMLAGVAALSFGAHAESDRSVVPASVYEHAQQRVQLPSGRYINLFCLGHGTPTVMLEAGGGDDSLSWRKVQARMARNTRVCSYDRAGFGFSDPARSPHGAEAVTDDLHQLLQAAHISTPIVLVGHSVGGLFATLYAQRFPDHIAGMVLVDPTTVEQEARAIEPLNAAQRKTWQDSNDRDIAQIRQCLQWARLGELAGTPAIHRACLDDPPNADSGLHRTLNAQLAQASNQIAQLDEALDTYPPTLGALSPAERLVQRKTLLMRNKPLIVLVPVRDPDDDTPIAVRHQVYANVRKGADALVAQSNLGEKISVPHSQHYIQNDQPDTVVAEVIRAVQEVRAAPER